MLVDDNNRVQKGDLLVQLDKEPYQVQVDIAQAAVDTAQADLVAAQAQARARRGAGAQPAVQPGARHRGRRQPDCAAALEGGGSGIREGDARKAQADYDRALPLVSSGAVTPEELDHRKQTLHVAQAEVEEALQGVYQIRVGLGLPPKPETGDDLAAGARRTSIRRSPRSGKRRRG